MTAKKAQTRTMILLVVPFGFSMGTELLKTMPHSNHTDFPMVKVGPPGAEETDGGENKRVCFSEIRSYILYGEIPRPYQIPQTM